MTKKEQDYLDLIESRKTKTDAELQQEAESHFENDIKLESLYEQLEKQK
ncbi:MAG: hypothetical protein ACTSXL_02500 [Alphaproteobacteria bacterium]